MDPKRSADAVGEKKQENAESTLLVFPRLHHYEISRRQDLLNDFVSTQKETGSELQTVLLVLPT